MSDLIIGVIIGAICALGFNLTLNYKIIKTLKEKDILIKNLINDLESDAGYQRLLKRFKDLLKMIFYFNCKLSSKK